GDYWRVIPIKHLVGKSALTVMPLSSCTVARNTLSSGVWQPDLRKHSVAYLLSLDRSLTDFPQCSLNQVIAAYGRPNSSISISGSLNHPDEVLLFYDRGVNHSAPKLNSVTQKAATVVPIPLQD